MHSGLFCNNKYHVLCLKCKHDIQISCALWPGKTRAPLDNSHTDMPVICIHANISLCVFVVFGPNTSFDIKQDWPLLFWYYYICDTYCSQCHSSQAESGSLRKSPVMSWFVACAWREQMSERLWWGGSATREGRRTVWERLHRRLCRVTRVTSCHCSLSSVGNSTR